MVHTSLENVRDFVALSYCWGGQTLGRPITVDGSRMCITESLEAALLNLQSRGQDGFFLWADGICINQQDLSEKNLQVQIMREIYSAAVGVLIWLRSSTNETDNAIKGIRHLGDRLLRTRFLELVMEKRWELVPWIVQPDDGSDAAGIRREFIHIMIEYRQATRQGGMDPFSWLSPQLASRQWFRVNSLFQCADS